MYYFEYAPDGQPFRLLDKVDCSLVSTEVAGGFTGVVVGMYATANPRYAGTGKYYADFDYFDYREN